MGPRVSFYTVLVWFAHVLIAVAAPAHAQLALSSANTSLHFDATVLRNLGVELHNVQQTGTPAESGAIGFRALDGQQVVFLGRGTDFEGFADLDLKHAGGLSLVVDGRSVDLSGFRLAEASSPHDMQLLDARGRRWFWIGSSHARLAGRELHIDQADLLIGPALAALLGRPDLSDTYIGVLETTLTLAQPVLVPRGIVECEPNFIHSPDVELIELSAITQGAYEPGVRVSIAPRAKLRNNGPGDVKWNWSIMPDTPNGPHPFLSLHFYSLVGGVLEQIGVSDLKHGFFATNSGCDCDGAHVLFSTCTDTYGVNTNLNPYHLSPRYELSAHTRTWTSLGSHFDGTPVDDDRDHGGASHHDGFEHRLVVEEARLLAPGARFFAEGWYLAANDSNMLNSMGHREVDPNFAGATWSFPTIDAGLTLGSILDELVDPQNPGPGEASQLIDTFEGRVQLAAVSTDLGSGVHHYEYALMNFDFERNIASFELPLDGSISLTNPGFGDGDNDPNNDWTTTVSATAVTWTAPAGAALEWARLANFRFDANAPPVQTTALLTPLIPPLANVVADTVGPAAAPILMPVSGFVTPWLIASALTLALALYSLLRRGRGAKPVFPGSRS